MYQRRLGFLGAAALLALAVTQCGGDSTEDDGSSVGGRDGVGGGVGGGSAQSSGGTATGGDESGGSGGAGTTAGAGATGGAAGGAGNAGASGTDPTGGVGGTTDPTGGGAGGSRAGAAGDTVGTGDTDAAGASGFSNAGAAGDAECAGAYTVSAECEAEGPEVVAAFVPSDQPVHCTDAAVFCFEGRQVRLIHVEYGELRDCMAGCFASNLCAIEDPAVEAPQLFYAGWNASSEAPLGIDDECPDLSREETWPDCVPAGLRHPLVETEEFRSFAVAEEGIGPLRYCVNRYVLDGTWP